MPNGAVTLSDGGEHVLYQPMRYEHHPSTGSYILRKISNRFFRKFVRFSNSEQRISRSIPLKNQEFEVKYLVIRRSEVTNLAYAKETNYLPQEKIVNAKLVTLESAHSEPTPAFVNFQGFVSDVH